MNRDDLDRDPHRLHNSGPGAREVIRCAPIGIDRRVDLFQALYGCQEVPRRLVYAFRRDAETTMVVQGKQYPAFTSDMGRITPTLAVDVCGVLLAALGVAVPEPAGAAPHQHARTLLRLLLDHVVEQGWHEVLLGLVTHGSWPPAHWRTPARTGQGRTTPADAALALAAFAVYAPPVLLWTRTPSLDWVRCDVFLQVRQLWGGGGAA
jgi:hypothetical protein